MFNFLSSIPKASQGIFLVPDGLQPTIIESQVILTCSAMLKKGINIEIWSLCGTINEYSEAKKRILKLKRFGVPIFIFKGIKTGLPLSEFINALILVCWLLRRERKPSFIHCRTEYSAMLAILIKIIIGSKVIWDSRGDTVSEYKLFIKDKPFIRRLLSSISIFSVKYRLMLSKNFADYKIFVSESLRNLYIKNHKKNSFIIPCVADKTYFYFSPKLRETSRAEMSLIPSDVVLIYVGSMALWQCVNDTIKIINDHLSSSDKHKAIIITPDKKEFISQFPPDTRHRLICRSVSLIDVNKYLNAADYAIFLREKNNINKVASPVKFAEYCMAGLPILMTDAVEQSFSYAIKLGNLVHVELGETIKLPERFNNEKRLAVSSRTRLLLSNTKTKKTLYEIYKEIFKQTN